jgi:hypothetical protein
MSGFLLGGKKKSLSRCSNIRRRYVQRYKTKNNVLIPSINAKAKHSHYYSNGNSEELKNLKEQEKEQFDETINVSNVYNRLISFEAGEYHAAQNYFGQDDESRLILVFFVSKFDAHSLPLERANLNKI